MDLLTSISVLVASIVALLIFRGRGDHSKDAVPHASKEASLLEREKKQREELAKMDKDLEKIKEEMKDKTPEEVEAFWNEKK
jgi:hypothetical protein